VPHTWDPDRYLTYADERGRPFVELVARIGAAAPAEVVDLGCGAGNLTGLLAERWPEAHVVGLDSSPEMITAAQKSQQGLGQSVTYAVADLRDWQPERPVDVLVSNATLQWVPGHLELLPSLVAAVAPGGWFAFQVPGNFDEPSHTIRAELAAAASYAEHTASLATPSSHDPAVYYDALTAAGCSVDVWETTYTHVLHGPDPVFTWVSGTGARPTLQALPSELRPSFEAEFKRRLAAAYPVRADGTVLLPFRRVFAVARVAS
jgi:trans-aconitate 2-methyltransferase